jgi:hypothetical protein
MIALLIGTVIALVAVAFVLVPLFRDDPASSSPSPMAASPEDPSEDDAIGALREIEFDRVTGKLSDGDYSALKSRYTADALEAMRAAESEASAPDASDLAEQAVLRYRQRTSSCESCGPRPEPDAVYCSTCGRYLPGKCASCNAPVSELAARFCPSCGKRLAA